MQLTNGKTYKEFYNDSTFWHREAWHEDEVLTVNNKPWGDRSVDNIPDDAIVRVVGGIVHCHDSDWHGCNMSMDELFAAWRGDDTYDTILVRVPKERWDEFCALAKALGCDFGD